MNYGQPPAATARLARVVPTLLVATACLFNAIAYQSELSVAAPDVNDDVFHLGLAQRMNAAWEAGGDPLDTWIGDWGQGFPVLRYYQHLPHLAVVSLHRLLGSSVALPVVFDAMTLLLLVLLPLAFYFGSRRLGAAPMTAACIALVTPLLGADPSEQHFLGFQARSFLWSGGGLFTQLAAMVLFPLALGATSQAALDGRRLARAIAWLGATWLSHLVLGYIACLLGLAVLLRPEACGQRGRVLLRLAAIYIGVAFVASYLLVPTLLESRWLAHSRWEPVEYWDSYGARHVLQALVTGGLLDGNRIPVLTLLAGAGAWLAGRTWRAGHRGPENGFAVAALGMFVLALLLYFGRPTWGGALGLLPFAGSLPFHRFICAVQFGGLLLAGLALSRLAAALDWPRDARRTAVAGLAVALLLGPAVVATTGIALRNASWRTAAAREDAAARVPLEAAFTDFRKLYESVPGRGYAGTSWNWGNQFRLGGVQVFHRWTSHGLPAISYMYHTMGLMSDLEPSFDPSRRDHFELFNVRHLLADGEQRLPPFAERRLVAPGLVSGLVRTKGFFDIAGSAAFFRYARGEADELQDLNRAYIASHWHARRRFVRIGWRDGDGPSAGEANVTAGQPFDSGRSPAWQAPRGEVVASGGDGDRYHATVRLLDPGYILFRMTYHPNWHAELDGQPVATEMLAPGYIGVAAPPGTHLLAMTYHPPRWNRLLMWCGLGFLALLAWLDGRRRPRAAPGPGS